MNNIGAYICMTRFKQPISNQFESKKIAGKPHFKY